MILQGSGGGGGWGSFCRVRIFISNLLLASMDAGFFIYFPKEPDHNIYSKVLTESTDSTVRPLTKKRDQFQPFPNSTDCHTKHIAMIHGLRPSTYKWHICKFSCSKLRFLIIVPEKCTL